MRKRNLLAIVAVCLWLLPSCSSESEVEPVDNPVIDEEIIGEGGAPDWLLVPEIELTSDEKDAMEGVNEFSHALMKEASMLSDDGAFCVSPVSVSINLGMLANASAGDLRKQILQSMNARSLDGLNVLFEKLMHFLPCEDYGSSLGIYNRLWVEEGKTVPSQFSDVMASVFNAGIDYVDFTDENSIRVINEWVNTTTCGKIPEVLAGDLHAYSGLQMFCANTVYFKGDWLYKFGRDETTKETFHATSGDKTVDMMHKSTLGTYAANEMVQSMTMSFEGSENNMELYLPAEGTGIRELVEALTNTMQMDLKSNRHLRDIELSVPSFRSEMTVDLPMIMKRIGITGMDNADLSPMGLGKMPVSSIQRTSIKVDEDGAELAAATVEWAGHPYPSEDEVVVLDFNRPFIYIIRNVSTGAIMMAGAVTDF